MKGAGEDQHLVLLSRCSSAACIACEAKPRLLHPAPQLPDGDCRMLTQKACSRWELLQDAACAREKVGTGEDEERETKVLGLSQGETWRRELVAGWGCGRAHAVPGSGSCPLTHLAKSCQSRGGRSSSSRKWPLRKDSGGLWGYWEVGRGRVSGTGAREAPVVGVRKPGWVAVGEGATAVGQPGFGWESLGAGAALCFLQSDSSGGWIWG